MIEYRSRVEGRFFFEKHPQCEQIFKWISIISDKDLKSLLETSLIPINQLFLKLRSKFEVSKHRNNIVREVEEIYARLTNLIGSIDLYCINYPVEKKLLEKILINLRGPLLNYIDGLRIK